MLLALLLVYFCIFVVGSGDSSRLLYSWCAKDERCAAAYHIRIDEALNHNVFEFLLRLRTDAAASDTWSDLLLRHYGLQSSEAPVGESLQMHWLHLMRSVAPHCAPCDDAIKSDAGVECESGPHQLRFDSTAGVYKCATPKSRRLEQQSDGGAAPTSTVAEFHETAHTPRLTTIAIWLLAIPFILGALTQAWRNLKQIRAQSKAARKAAGKKQKT